VDLNVNLLVARLLLFRPNICLILTPTSTHLPAHIIAQSRAALVVREVKASSGKMKWFAMALFTIHLDMFVHSAQIGSTSTLVRTISNATSGSTIWIKTRTIHSSGTSLPSGLRVETEAVVAVWALDCFILLPGWDLPRQGVFLRFCPWTRIQWVASRVYEIFDANSLSFLLILEYFCCFNRFFRARG